MLEFLQTGKALYVLAALCGVGVVTRWLTRNLYKRLIKESDNMSLTKNKSLRAFKQKTETTYQMNMGIPKIKPYLEKQMYDFKYMGITLQGWNIFSNQMTLWCFLVGGGAAFAAYWFRTDPYYIVLYGSVGILTGLFTILVDHGAGIAEKRQQLFASLDNYLENTLIYRLNMEQEELRDAPNVRTLHSSLESQQGISSEGMSEQDRRAERRNARQRARTWQIETPLKGRQLDQPAEEAAGALAPTELKSSRRDVDYLKHSLEQIAASKEKARGGRSGEDWLKELNPDELKLVGEILQEYLT